LYNTLVQDILYKDPMRNEIFFDNHDQNRFYSVVGEDFSKFKMGIALLFTQRGIPQLYYGTEILMKNFMNPSDAEVRKDFPGGWKEDTENKFLASGRTALENEAFNYVKVLAQFRKSSPALQTGKFMQYVPEDGLYVYFRYTDRQTVMCLMNTSPSPKEIEFSKYAERTGGFSKALNIQNGDILDTHLKTAIPGKTMWVLDLKK
jgi:glycosidase